VKFETSNIFAGDIHCQRVIIDFARVTRLNCGCHPLNAGSLAGLGKCVSV